MKIIIVPAHEAGRGGGHISRCVSLACDLRAQDREALLYLPQNAADMDGFFKAANFNPDWRITENDLKNIYANTVECIILDRFQTPPQELERWKEIAPVIGIDEGGKDRDNFDFLIDILIPQKLASPKANISSPALLKFEESHAENAERHVGEKGFKVLVSFGQEDSAGLGVSVARELAESNDGELDITLLRGSLAKGEIEGLAGVRVLEAVPHLAEHLGEYDLLVTHYGITAYEALFAGVPALLAHPTPYHRKLAKAAGFIAYSRKRVLAEARRRRERGEGLRVYYKDLAIKYGMEPIQNGDGSPLATLVNSLSPMVNRTCPLCGENTPKKSLARFKDRTYRRCKRCGVIYMDRTAPPPIEYEKEYFFSQYEKQYGKTYIQDFPNLITMAKKRLKTIKALLPTPSPLRLLDIGCAYGPFLAASREEGFTASGIDPAEDAVSYVQKELGIPAVVGFFPNCALPSPAPYDVVSLWYVIEHFTDCVTVLCEIRKILKPGGVLAFSTPSFSGISGRSSLKDFLSKSPADHFTIWSPKMCKKALALAGFKVKKIAVSGHHPERFPFFGRFVEIRKNRAFWLLYAISKIFRLGDTFEVFAQAAENNTSA